MCLGLFVVVVLFRLFAVVVVAVWFMFCRLVLLLRGLLVCCLWFKRVCVMVLNVLVNSVAFGNSLRYYGFVCLFVIIGDGLAI